MSVLNKIVCLLFYLFCVPCLNGFSIDRNYDRCLLSCGIFLEPDADSFYCGRTCQVYQCKTGCMLYSLAIKTYSCQDLCELEIQQNTTADELSTSVASIKTQSCVQGCKYGLDNYYRSVVPISGLDLPAPVVVRDNITHDSLELDLGFEHELENSSFILQCRILETDTEWQIHDHIDLIYPNSLLVTNLFPYLTYKFKLIYEVTTIHFVETEESSWVMTLPYGVPSSSPMITSLRAPSSSAVSMSWVPPVYTNGPLLSYRLSLHAVDNADHVTSTDVPQNYTSWIFGHLHAGEKYEVRISAVNKEGEGPAHVMHVSTPTPGNLGEREMPYLILGAENMVVKQRLLELTREAEKIFQKPKTISIQEGATVLFQSNTTSDLIQGVGIHVSQELVLVSDSSGRVTLINVSGDVENDDMYPILSNPTAIDIDWLNNHAYVVDGYRVYKCPIKYEGGYCQTAFDNAPDRLREVKVDPLNGFLYFTLLDSRRGLYRVDMADLGPNSRPSPKILIDADLRTFFIDQENLLLYFPNNTENTMMSTYLDGTGVTDIRKGAVARPHFTNTESMVYYDNLFFWTNGTKVFSEEYDSGNRTYYHNSLLLFEKHFCGFNMLYPRAQPIPAPFNPPSQVQALFTADRAIIEWKSPELLNFQGRGAFNTWSYEVYILPDDGTNNSLNETTRHMKFVVSNLVPDTPYQVKVRAKSPTGTGPWSEVFHGRTVKQDLASAKLITAVQQLHNVYHIMEMNVDGSSPVTLLETSPIRAGVRDLEWVDDKLFWTTDDGELLMHEAGKNYPVVLDFVGNMATLCVAYDWLGERLYWSLSRTGVIKRADIYGNNIEFVHQAAARNMVIDSINGRIYWVTTYTVETTNLNGENHFVYFSLKFFTGVHVISLSIDHDHQKLYWYVKGYEDQSLYTADLYSNAGDTEAVSDSIKLVGSFADIEKFSTILYFSNRMLWLDKNSSITIGDTECNNTATIYSVERPVTMFTVRHPSLHQVPGHLNSSAVIVVPFAIDPKTIRCKGQFSNFTIVWQPSVEVNHGKVSYELSVHTDALPDKVTVTEDPWYEIEGLPPYVPVTVSVRGLTYWGSGPITTTTIRSPMGVPTQPRDPRVYVTQRKNTAESEVTLAADFRWTEPVSNNGIFSKQNVFYWMSSQPDHKSSTTLPASARHYILDGLEANTTYFFQVESCTEVGCSPKSVVANATADAVNPVPKLLLATKDSIIIAEADNVQNTSKPVASKSVTAMSYLSRDNHFYWITRDKTLEQFPMASKGKLLQLKGEGHSMTLDWVSRTLYTVESSADLSTIHAYHIDQPSDKVLLTRNGKVDRVIVDPYTSTILWSEQMSPTSPWTIMSAHTDGTQLGSHFSSRHAARRRRAENNVCNCHEKQVLPSGAMAIDLSQDGKMEVVFVDKTNLALVAADMTACKCRTVLRTTPDDRKGLPPDQMTVDHVYIYWYNRTEQILYSMDKASGRISKETTPDLSDILAFGSHLQPLPASECLDIKPYTDKVDILSYTNTSIRVSLQEVVWPDGCANISHPATRYTVYYRKLDEMNPNDDCQPDGLHCMSQFSFNEEITLEGLEPYTRYILQGAVSNYYAQYASKALGEPTVVLTKAGVPPPASNITAYVDNPNNITIQWRHPYVAHGPLDKIMYYVQWSTISHDGTTKNVKIENITSDQSDPRTERFTKTIKDLTPDQLYTIKVITIQTDGNYATESAPIEVRTYDVPNDLNLTEITNTTLTLSWRSPYENIISRVIIHCAEERFPLHDPDHLLQGIPFLPWNNLEFNETFTGLTPDTEYLCCMYLLYEGTYSLYHWPNAGSSIRYVFKTLTGIPGMPDPPTVKEIKTGEFEISWTSPADNGEPITHYLLQYRHVDMENWSIAYNTSDLRWVVNDAVLRRGETYMFRVIAENKNGWSPVSLNSSLFSYPLIHEPPTDGMLINVVVICSFVFVVIAMGFIAICFTVCRHRKEEKERKRKHAEFLAVPRSPDIELATLRELPIVLQQSNALYAMNIVPTDDEIAALPHFRRDQLVLCKFLGSGAFGEVFEGVAKNILNESSGDTRCAVKTLRKSASDQEKEEFLKEALLMSNFKHEHILSLLGVCLDNDPQFIILELMEGGDLLSFMRACRLSSIQNRTELSLTDLVKICVHVSRGCKYLEDMHFVHRDLAARNCLVSSCNPANMVIKIGDFGLARDIYKNDYYRKEGEGLLPVRWMSPESLVDGVFTTQSDIWAFGVMMWEVVTFGQQPYPARTNIEVLHYVRSGGRLDRPDNCPDDFYQLMCKCWSFAPEDRPSFAYLLQELEKFKDMCASISEYLVPIRSNNGPIQTGGIGFLGGRPCWRSGQEVHPSEPKLPEESGWVQVPDSEKQEADVDLIRWT